MKKRSFSLVLALVMLLSLLPLSVMAASEPSAEDLKTPPVISNLEIHDDAEGCVWLEVTVQTPANVLNAIDYYENHELGYNQAGYIGGITLEYSIDGGEWQESSLAVAWRYYEDADEVPRWNGIHETHYLDELHVNSEVKAHARYTGADAEGNLRYSDWSNLLTLNEKVDFNAHDWATAELTQAAALGLIPESMKDKDLTLPITRAEFAAVSVLAYQALTGETAAPVAENPFQDTADEMVLKAVNVGITNGTGDGTTFSPDMILNRETMSTMLTRVYKKATLPGWTLATDGQFKLEYTKGNAFADDAQISPWAYDSVYFMAANGIVKGGDGNRFFPNDPPGTAEALKAANATREQALMMAARMVTNLG